MIQKFFHFLKYHNAVSVSAVFLIVAGGSFAASEDLRDGVGGALLTKTETIISTDNTRLLNADLDSFNAHLQIKAVSEDGETYYVTYQYQTLEIRDSIWQDAIREETLKISKAFLLQKKGDLGIYVAEELGELISYQRSFLKEVQTAEREKGKTEKVASIAYAGLIGKFLEPETEVFPGYEPVVEPSPEEPASVPPADAAAQQPLDEAAIRQLVAEEVRRVLAEGTATETAPAAPAASSSDAPASDASAGSAASSSSDTATSSETASPAPAADSDAASSPDSAATTTQTTSEPEVTSDSTSSAPADSSQPAAPSEPATEPAP